MGSLQMTQCIQFRRKTFLDSVEWRTKTWADCQNTIQGTLLQYGFRIGALIEQIDNSGLQQGEIPLEGCLPFISQFLEIDTELDDWFQGYIDGSSPSLIFAVAPAAAETSRSESSVAFSEQLGFPNLREASTTMVYWALKLCVSTVINMICSPLLEKHPALRPDAPTAMADTQSRGKLEEIINEHGRDHCLHLSNSIMRMVVCVAGDDKGLIGAQLALFPLRTVLFVLNRYPGEELRQVEEIYAQLDNEKGLHCAAEIAKFSGGYAEEGGEQAIPHEARSQEEYSAIYAHQVERGVPREP